MEEINEWDEAKERDGAVSTEHRDAVAKLIEAHQPAGSIGIRVVCRCGWLGGDFWHPDNEHWLHVADAIVALQADGDGI